MTQPCQLNVSPVPEFMPELQATEAPPRPPVMNPHPVPVAPLATRYSEERCQQLALGFIAMAIGANGAEAITARHIRHYVAQPSQSRSPAADLRWHPDAAADAAFGAWADEVREKNAAELAKGPHAYADALMRTVFPAASKEVPALPYTIYRTWIAIDQAALELSLALGVDFGTLDIFCSRIQRHFLFNAFLLPRLRVEPSDFPQPCPSAASLREELIDAFFRHAKPALDLLTKYSETLLTATRKAELTYLWKVRKVTQLLNERAADIDAMGGLKQDFLKDATDLLGERLNHPGYALRCLLEAYFSYPKQIHEDLDRRESAEGADDDPQCEKKRIEFEIQHRLWKSDLETLARQRPAIDRLGEHGKEYFLGRLRALSRSAYRPRLRPLRLEHVLAAARLQPEVIAEEAEPPR